MGVEVSLERVANERTRTVSVTATPARTVLPDRAPAAALPEHRRVLVVEDDRVTADLLRYILAEEGWDVDVLHTGSDALRTIRSGPPPALVLTDLFVPQVGGFELVRAVRASIGWEAVPLVLLTAHWSGVCERDAFRAGADAVYGKPFDPDELLAALRPLVEHGRA